MADRFRRSDQDSAPADNGGAVATDQRNEAYATDAPPSAERTSVLPGRQDTNGDGVADTGTRRTAGDAVVLDREARLRQRDEFGGINWGAAFFGWIVAIGLGVLLTAIVSAAGAAIGLTDESTAKSNAVTIGIVGGALLIAIAVIAYYAGGYVAGRMSRFDGGKQGLAVWLIGLVVTLIAIGLGALFGDQYNIFDRVNLPRLPISTDQLSTGGLITAIAVLVVSLLAAMLGGKVGHRYHDKVDRVVRG